MNTIRRLLSLAMNFGWNLQHYDVKNVFLYGKLKEEIYMETPPGYEEVFGIDKVCKLKKPLYGLKQSPQVCFGRFTAAMLRT